MWRLGIDTSNYTTSAALYNTDTGELRQRRCPLPVPSGRVGLRQSEATFLHVKQLGGLLDELLREEALRIEAVGVSDRPRDVEGSYMPCFLAGVMAAQAVSGSLRIPLHRFSHQAGHIAAALVGAGALDLTDSSFLAVHASGGTTECLLVEPKGGERVFDIRILGRTLDLNAGQVIDRVGAMLNLPFPAGSALEALAEASAEAYVPKPVLRGMDCSLSGLENQCAHLLECGTDRANVAAYCQSAVAQTILAMALKAADSNPGLRFVFAGGVMSNNFIRGLIREKLDALFAPPELSTDNAAGVAVLCGIRGEGGAGC